MSMKKKHIHIRDVDYGSIETDNVVSTVVMSFSEQKMGKNRISALTVI